MPKEEDEKAPVDEAPKTGASAEAIQAAKKGSTTKSDADDDSDDDSDADDDREAVDAPVVEATRAPASPGRPRLTRAVPLPPPPAPNTGVRVVVFVLVLGVLSSGFWLLSGFDSGLDKPTVKWRNGQMVDLELTLVKDDATNLACSSPQDIGGRKCQYSNKTDQNAGLTDATTYKPYTTTDGVQFLGAGLWSQPAMDRGKLPTDRFAVKCKMKVDGQVKSPLIRWNPSMSWIDKKDDWYAGLLSDCKVNPP